MENGKRKKKCKHADVIRLPIVTNLQEYPT